MKYPFLEIKKTISSILATSMKQLGYTQEIRLEIPPNQMGDFSFPCFQLCSQSKKSPNDTAKEIVSILPSYELIKSIDVVQGYINFHINTEYLISETIALILSMKHEYGNLSKKEKKVIIEHTSANPNGPFHVGRARNPIIGDTLTRLYRAAGYNCESQYYVDDLGKQVAILTWGLNNFSEKDIGLPNSDKPDHIAVGYYQKAYEQMKKNEGIEQEIGFIVKQSEHGDKETLKKIHTAYKPALEGMKESLQSINISIDTYIPESTFVQNKSVEQVIETLKKTKYCKKENGAYFLDLASFGIQGRSTKFFFVRNDGTSLYATRDIAYHQWKAQQADLLINVLGEDHKLESKQVEIGLTLCKVTNIPKTVFYAFVSLPEGKMSTRQGRVIYLDDLINECIQRAYIEVKKRRGEELTEQQMRTIAEIIGTGALRYNIIKVQPEKDIEFKWEDALNFEGNSAPFIQYAHARSASILAKHKTIMKYDKTITNALSHPSEIILIKKLSQFPEIIMTASEGFKPHLIANYLFDTASSFNQFYRDCPVLSDSNEKRKQARIHLVQATKIVLRNGLRILGIQAPDEM